MTRQLLVGQSLLITEASQSHSVTHFTLGKIRPDKWSALRWNLYMTGHNIQKRQISIPPERFEPTIPVSDRPQASVLHRAATGIGLQITFSAQYLSLFIISFLQNFLS
jgi:hypothetical protein